MASIALPRSDFGSTIRGVVQASDQRTIVQIDEGVNEAQKPVIARIPK
ncbi:MAG: hypothetical protein ACRDJ3_12535 [Solirubrobacteraceae bacterium]